MTEPVQPPEHESLTEKLRRVVGKAQGAVGDAVGRAGGAMGDAVGKAGGAVGDLIASAGQVADTTGRRAALSFLGGRRKDIPSRSPQEVAEAMAGWLRRRHSVELSEIESGWEVSLEEAGWLGKSYVFHFTSRADEQATSRLERRAAGCAGGALVALRWPASRLSLRHEVSLFIWEDGVRLGGRGAAADYVSIWLMEELGFQFDALDLTPGEPATPRPSLFIGRAAPLEQLTEALGQPRRWGSTPWIYCLTGLGGTGKSYLLRHLEESFGARVLMAQVDHQSCQEGRQDLQSSLIALLQSLAQRLERAGCPCPRFDRALARLVRQTEGNPPEEPAKPGVMGYLGKLWELGKGKNPVLMAADVGLQLYQAHARELRDESDALANHAGIRGLTRKLVEDLDKFVSRQRKSCYLWRRPVLAFDTYEWLSVLVDNWLRSVLLKDADFLALEPVILVAGRHELLRVNTRWSEFQEALRTIRLDPFSLDEADRYMLTLGVDDPERRRAMYELTGGAPLFLSLVANSPTPEMAVKALSERILEEVDPAWRQLFLDLSVPEGFNRDVVARLVEGDPVQAFERLVGATFVQAGEGQWRYAPAVRQILLSCLSLESPERLARLQARL